MIHTAPVAGRQPADGCPTSDVDLWADEVLVDPYPTFAGLREQGSVVWLPRYGLAALPRFQEVRTALADWRTFSSAEGVAAGARGNGRVRKNVIASDPPEHGTYRKPLADQLNPAALAEFTDEIETAAQSFAALVADAGELDVVTDLARPYSLQIVADMVGLPEDGREMYPQLAARSFDVMGPDNDRSEDGLAGLTELERNTFAHCQRLEPGRLGDRLCQAGSPELLAAYTWPGIDTTVNALSSAMYLFTAHPEQWARVRADRSLIPSAFNEVLRMHAPVHHFTRVVTTAIDVDGVVLPAGARVLIMYGSANRDGREFPEPDRFDVTRNPVRHVAFGRGVHLCVGMNLARMEAHSLLDALADRVERFAWAGRPRWMVNNTLHGLESCRVRVVS